MVKFLKFKKGKLLVSLAITYLHNKHIYFISKGNVNTPKVIVITFSTVKKFFAKHTVIRTRMHIATEFSRILDGTIRYRIDMFMLLHSK